MPARVPDASVVAAFVFGEPRAREAARLLEGAELFAPSLLAYELANVACTKIRKDPASREGVLEGLRVSARLGIALIQADRIRAAELALERNLSAYDAAYLLVARATGGTLVTFDAKLAAAARVR